jgi:hypothetical protein
MEILMLHAVVFCYIEANKCSVEIWRGGRVVEGAALEKQYARKGIVGSNPTLSAIRLASLAHAIFGERIDVLSEIQ